MDHPPADSGRWFLKKTHYMKSRELKRLLNNTEYTVAFYGKYIGIGSPLCHDLIKLDITTNKITYALDTWKRGRSSVLHHEELTFIWDKLHELVETGAITEIINGNDVIDNPLPVYTVRKGVVIYTTTDAYGWPNTTVDGHMMHDNTYFKTIAEAVDNGIKEYQSEVRYLNERLIELKEECGHVENRIQEGNKIIENLKSLKPDAEEHRINTMTDPNLQPAEGQQATEEVAALESASQDKAMEATDSEEGSTEG